MNTHLIYSTDPNGQKVVGVKLSNRPDRCWLYQRDYDAIVAEFGQCSWFMNSNGQGSDYVRLKDRTIGNNRNVARLVFGSPFRTHIRYRDGDRLNLRSRNLEMQVGSGGCPKKRRKSVKAIASDSSPAHASL